MQLINRFAVNTMHPSFVHEVMCRFFAEDLCCPQAFRLVVWPALFETGLAPVLMTLRTQFSLNFRRSERPLSGRAAITLILRKVTANDPKLALQPTGIQHNKASNNGSVKLPYAWAGDKFR